MKIKITLTDGSVREFDGDVSYNTAYVDVGYLPDSGGPWQGVVIPWHMIAELEMRP